VIDHEPHISDLRWDRLLAGDLPDDARRVVDDHAAKCVRCSTRLRELTAERDAFQSRPVHVAVSPASRSPSAARDPRSAGFGPAYRDDTDAARARCAALEAELRSTRDQLAQLAHLADELTKRRRRMDGPEHPELEDRVVELQRELRDLETLRAGDAAMAEELAAIEQRATDRRGQGELELHVAGRRARALAGPMWAPRRRRSRTPRTVNATVVAALRLVPAVWGAAVAIAASRAIDSSANSPPLVAVWLFVTLVTAVWFGALSITSLVAAVRGGREETKIETSLVGPDEVCGRPWSDARAIRCTPTELVVSFPDRDLVFDRANLHAQVVVDYARAAAVKHGLEVDGELPALPEVSNG
jgi:hypothetical protein